MRAFQLSSADAAGAMPLSVGVRRQAQDPYRGATYGSMAKHPRISGATAVGTFVFVAWALITNAFADNLFPVINVYSSPTWAIVTAVPLLSLAYLLGLLSIGAGEALMILFKFVPANCLDERQMDSSSEPA